ncbi:MAG: hypothetical protein JNN11_00610 [Candidatus Doudnabacteria bacterium]|nr:hypothetical protein [Candidatus Doudnabacteria bacterium]
MSKVKNAFKFLAALGSAAVPWMARAQNGGIDGGLNRIGNVFPQSGGLTGARTASELIISIIDLMLIFAGMIAVMFIIIGGYWYITSAGNEEQAEKGKGTLLNAIIGIVLIVLSWVIIRVVTNLVGNDRI